MEHKVTASSLPADSKRVTATERWSELEQASNGDTVLQRYEMVWYNDGTSSKPCRTGAPRPMVYVAGQWYLRDQIEREH